MHQIPSLDNFQIGREGSWDKNVPRRRQDLAPANTYFQIGREGSWNKNVTRRRRALAPSNSESSNSAESVTPPPPPESLIPKPPALPVALKKSSSCTCKKSNCSSKRRNESCSLHHAKSCIKLSKETFIHQMEAKLMDAELEESMNCERLEKGHRRLHRVTQLLDAQVTYMQSLALKAKATNRLMELAGGFSYKDLAPSESLSQTLEKLNLDDRGLLKRLADVLDVGVDYNETPDRFYEMLEEFREKRKDYKTASSSLSQYLKSSRVSTNVLRKYEAQYDAIKKDYELMREAVEYEIPALIQERYKVIEHCFSHLAPVQQGLSDQDTHLAALMKDISKIIKEQLKKQPSCQHGCGDAQKVQQSREMHR